MGQGATRPFVNLAHGVVRTTSVGDWVTAHRAQLAGLATQPVGNRPGAMAAPSRAIGVNAAEPHAERNARRQPSAAKRWCTRSVGARLPFLDVTLRRPALACLPGVAGLAAL